MPETIYRSFDPCFYPERLYSLSFNMIIIMTIGCAVLLIAWGLWKGR